MSGTKKIAIGLLALGAWLAPASGASAARGPAWQLNWMALPTHLRPGTTGTSASAPIYDLVATNIGAGDATGPITLRATLPPNVTPIFDATAPAGGSSDTSVPKPSCSKANPGQTVTCTTEGPVHPSRSVSIKIPVVVSGALVSGEVLADATASIESPGAAPVSASTPTVIDEDPPPFGFLAGSAGLSALFTGEDGSPFLGAGLHPDQLTLNLGFPVDQPGGSGLTTGAGHPRDIVTDLPPGVVINPNATAVNPSAKAVRCTEVELISGAGADPGCPAESQIGMVTVVTESVGPTPTQSALYNMVPPPGAAASVAFNAASVGIYVHVLGGVRSDSDYGLYAESRDTLARSQQPLEQVLAQIWGEPTSSSHDQIRDECRLHSDELCPVDPSEVPLITMPSACSENLTFAAHARSWEEAVEGVTELTHHASAQATSVAGIPTGVSECSSVEFEPSLTVRPDTSTAESPSGVEVELKVPQNEGVTREGELEPLNEVQRVTVSGKGSDGTFALSFEGQVTADLSDDATAAQVLGALNALSTVGTGDVAVSGGPAGSAPLAITFTGSLGHSNVPQLGAVSKSTSGQGEVVVTTIRQGRPAGEHGVINEPGRATSSVRDVTVAFPEGMALNPAAADGLDACSPAQIGMLTAVGQTPPHFNRDRPQCPEASKIGTVEVRTPLLDHPLPGAVYVAQPFQNPFGTLLGAYVVIDAPEDGIEVKLAGRTDADPNTGQLTVHFDENPQLPVESFKVNLFGGPRAALRTPSTCGSYTTTSVQVPWSGNPPAHTANSFEVTRGANGRPCVSSEAEMPNHPGFEAGTATPLAAAFSPFLGRLTRNDGEQQLKAFNATLPAGLTGKLAGVATCSDAAIAASSSKSGQQELASPSCPADSKIGEVKVGAGAGPSPYYTTGKIYLAGPYRAAPISAVAITPAVAGPFDLGTVAVREPAYLDPVTSVLSVRGGEEFPHILQGIPLELRDARISLARPEFTLNPTSCKERAIAGEAISLLGNIAPLSERFQVGGCRGLDYGPKLSIRLFGKTGRGAHPRLRAILTAKLGESNTARASVALPRSEFLENAHIQTVCTRVQFAADNCPAGSIYGHATAITPLLDEPLEGPVYLRSSSHELPDMVVALKGPPSRPIKVELAGRIDSVNGGIRSTFDFVPDQPVSKFILDMKGGKKGLIVNSRNVCTHTYRATAKFDGQNGKAHDFHPKLKASCKGKGKAKKGHRR